MVLVSSRVPDAAEFSTDRASDAEPATGWHTRANTRSAEDLGVAWIIRQPMPVAAELAQQLCNALMGKEVGKTP